MINKVSDAEWRILETSKDYEELIYDIEDLVPLNDNKEVLLNKAFKYLNDDLIVLGYKSLNAIATYAHNEDDKNVSKSIKYNLELYRVSENEWIKIFLINYLRSKDEDYHFTKDEELDVFV